MFIWTIWDAIGLIFLTLLAVGCFISWLARTIEMARCKHDGGVTETRACQAICRDCGKDLGFIGTWRDNESARSSLREEVK